jgi:hypothetical protein
MTEPDLTGVLPGFPCHGLPWGSPGKRFMFHEVEVAILQFNLHNLNHQEFQP